MFQNSQKWLGGISGRICAATSRDKIRPIGIKSVLLELRVTNCLKVEGSLAIYIPHSVYAWFLP